MTLSTGANQPFKTTLGAYALTPGPDDDDGRAEQEFYAGLGALPIEVIEFPLTPAGNPAFSVEWVEKFLKPEWDLLVTCIPRTMARLGTMPTYGLSSTDPDARQAALSDIAEVRGLAQALADKFGRPRVAAIEVHSAPGPGLGSVDAFQESLAELLTWDFAGAELIVEHCDALVPGQVVSKGFWPIEEEIVAIRAALETAGTDAASQGTPRLGVGINWGRSAIEGRSAATANGHIQAATEAGLLRSIIFSGASATDTAWGTAWGDAHIAPRGTDPAFAPSSDSLLGADEITAAFEAARGADLAYVGPKITVRPTDADVGTRLALARASLTQIADAHAAASADV